MITILEWKVYIGDYNARRIEEYNVFDHYSFLQDCKEFAKKYKDNRERFAEEVRRSLAYYFWSKCEWEIIIDHWPHNDGKHCKKVDVFDQVMLNWDHFIEYLWNHAAELRRKTVG